LKLLLNPCVSPDFFELGNKGPGNRHDSDADDNDAADAARDAAKAEAKAAREAAKVEAKDAREGVASP
jgi:hypothetical protein